MDPKLYEAAAFERSTNSSENLISNFDPNSVQITCGQGNTALHIAAKCGNKRAVERILRARPSLAYEANVKGDTPLHIAARSEHPEIAALLLERYEGSSLPAALLEAGGANPLYAVNNARDTALHEAVRNGRFGIAKMLIEKDRSLAGFRNAAGESPVFVAVDRGYYDTALCVLETFPHCSVFGRNGMTVMHAAIIRNEVGFVRKVLEICGPEILEIADEFGWMPLHCAAHLGNVDAVELILKTTSSLAYIKDNQGMSPIHISARNGKSRVLKRLIEARPDVCELLDIKDRTALHVAVDNGQKKAIKTLLDMMPIDDLINEQDLEGNTALHFAAIHANFEILQLLALDNRVDKGIVNNMEMTAFDIFTESTIELTQMGKKFKSALEGRCIFQSLKSTVVVESRRAQSAAQRGCEVSEEISREITLRNFASEEEIVRGNSSDRRTEEHTKRKATSGTEYVKNMANINLVIATLVVGITFAAAVQMPGGYNGDGIANLKGKYSFKQFLVYNSLAFGCAAGSLLTYFTNTIFSRIFQFLRRPQHGVPESIDIIFVMMFTAMSVSFAAAAFMYATNAVLHHNTGTKFDISHYLFWKLGLPATVANVSFSIPSLYLFYQLAPLIRLEVSALFRVTKKNQY